MMVAELLALLREAPPEARVETEGCDCVGEATGVSINGQTVTIIRTGKYVRTDEEENDE